MSPRRPSEEQEAPAHRLIYVREWPDRSSYLFAPMPISIGTGISAIVRAVAEDKQTRIQKKVSEQVVMPHQEDKCDTVKTFSTELGVCATAIRQNMQNQINEPRLVL